MVKLAILALVLLSAGCAARIVEVGRTYYVVWPNAEPDIVEIHKRFTDGWVQCRSVTDNVVWTCNLNTALYFVRVTQKPPEKPPIQDAPDGLRTD